MRLIGFACLCAISALIAPAAWAQFSGLSTTTDGAVVYFASPLTIRGTNEYLWPKIFRIDANGAALVAEVARSSPVPPTNNYILGSPQVSGDGTLLIYVGALECQEGSSCFLSEHDLSTLLNLTTGRQTYVGPNAVMSRNGRYLASYSSGNVFDPAFTLTDQTTGAALFTGSFSPTTVSIAANGTAVVIDGGQLELIQGGMLSTLLSSNVTAAVIDDAAANVVYATGSEWELGPLFVLNLSTMQSTQLGPMDQASYQPTISADGQWVTYISSAGSKPQAFLSRIDGSDSTQLTANAAGAVEVTLSGDAGTVYAIMGDYSMVRIDVATGAVTTLVGPTPSITSVQVSTPGSVSTITGTGLANTTVRIGEMPGLVLSSSDTSLTFQMPWRVPLTATSLTIPQGGAPYFADSTPIELGPFLPGAIALGPPDPVTDWPPIAIHSDFSSLVTPQSPAMPGELLHIYFLGGGAVSPPVRTGEVSPNSPLSKVTTPFSVTAQNGETVQVSFFGLAPGTIGVWQMDATVPPDWGTSFVDFTINFTAPPPNSFWESVGQTPIPVGTGT